MSILDEGPGSLPERLAAESWKYGRNTILLVRLDNSRFAIYNSARELQDIVDGGLTLNELIVKPPEPTAQPVANASTGSLDDLLAIIGVSK